jgi:hypothetical protein
MAPSCGSRQRSRVPAIEVEADRRQTEPAPPHLIQAQTLFRKRLIVKMVVHFMGAWVSWHGSSAVDHLRRPVRY